MRRIIPVLTAVAAMLLLGQSVATAAKPAGGSGTCTRNAPNVSIVNSYAWASSGSWAMPGQTRSYAVDVWNKDQGCGSSSFTVSFSASSGFAVSAPTTVSVPSSSDAYAWGTFTAPAGAANDSYAVFATVTRTGSAAVTAQSVYMVYSSDTTAPQIYWMNPANGGSVTGRSVSVGFASSDDHQVAHLEVALDGTQVAATSCSEITYDCMVSYAWSIRRASGQHSATFTSTDHVGNVARQTVTFTVN